MKTRDEFEAGMCKGRGWTLEYYRQHFVSLPCNCEDGGAREIPHWAKISLTDTGVLDHLSFHCPDQGQLMRMANGEIELMLRKAETL